MVGEFGDHRTRLLCPRYFCRARRHGDLACHAGDRRLTGAPDRRSLFPVTQSPGAQSRYEEL
jgi:hypothetical protein